MKLNAKETQKVIEAIESSSLSASQVIELIAGSKKTEKVVDNSGEIILNIDYTKTIEQAIADGNYDWKNDNITAQHFPVSPEMIGKKAEVSAKLFHFNRDISSDDVISEMDKAGYRPATLMELLVLGFLFPELQRQFPIVALGSRWHGAGGYRGVPYLFVRGRRELDLTSRGFADDWLAPCRFLGVRQFFIFPLH